MGCFFSGHRELPKEQMNNLFTVARQQITNAVVNYSIKDFYAGGAVGFDMIASMMVLSVKRNKYNHINLHLILPTPDYGRYQWKTVQEIEYYRLILQGVDTIETIAPSAYSGINFVRNQRLVELGCNLGIVYAEPDHKSGGTYSTIKMAQKNGTRIVNLYDFLDNT